MIKKENKKENMLKIFQDVKNVSYFPHSEGQIFRFYDMAI